MGVVAVGASFSAASGLGFWGCNRRKSGCEEAGRLQSASIWLYSGRRSRDIHGQDGFAGKARPKVPRRRRLFLSRLGAEARAHHHLDPNLESDSAHDASQRKRPPRRVPIPFESCPP